MISRLSDWMSRRRSLRHVLFAFAHPDDEVLCAGAFLNWSVHRNFVPHVLIFTRGEKGRNPEDLPEIRLAMVRQKEFRSVMRHLGVTHQRLADLPDGGLAERPDDVTGHVEAYCRKWPISLIVTHQVADETHPDHITVARAAKIVATTRRLPLLSSVNSGTSQFVEGSRDVFLPLRPDLIKHKMDLLRLYKSQITEENIQKMTAQLLFFPQERFVHIRPVDTILFRYVPYACKAYTFAPKRARYPSTRL